MYMRATQLVLLLLLGAFPFVAQLLNIDYYIAYASRILIFALAATGLNLVLGYGGMVALGHAAFLGAGAYAVVILYDAGFSHALPAWAFAMLLSAGIALLVGLVSLRTRGVYFIMITLAFAQMAYYLFISMRHYGGEDGFNLYSRSQLFGLDTDNDTCFYYVVLFILVLCLVLFARLVESRFGKALAGIRENEERMQALGYPVYRLKLTSFVISGAIMGLAGALLADLNQFVSPAAMHWTQSAHLLIMVLVGGMGLRYGGVAGAILILVLEELLRNLTEFWHLPMGVLLLLMLFIAPNGFASLWQAQSVRKKQAAVSGINA